MTPEIICLDSPPQKKRAPEGEAETSKRLKLSTPESTTNVTPPRYLDAQQHENGQGHRAEEGVISNESARTEAPIVELRTEAHFASDPVESPKLTKKQQERLEKQHQRELERLEREMRKSEERRLKMEEKERKEKERQAKKEMLEKEKERKREDERLRKEERKRKLEEDKKKREDEKTKREEEKKRKEEEKKVKEEEKRKKEEQKGRNQMKISNFFAIKPASDVPAVAERLPSAAEAVKESKVDSYDRDFLPFFQKKNVRMPPSAQLPEDRLAEFKSSFDEALLKVSGMSHIFAKLLSSGPTQSFASSQQLVEALNSSNSTERLVVQLVQRLPPLKYLHFYENAKPPYIGTWCSEKHLATRFQAALPLDESLTGFDYNYDSDLDWQDEDDEGEDIDDLEEGEEEEDEANEDDDMEDFVENNDAKRRLIGSLQSVSIWNDGSNPTVFGDLIFERLHYDIHFPINPHNDHWKISETTADKPLTLLSQLGTPAIETRADGTTHILTPQKPTIKDERVLSELAKFIEKNSDFTIGTLSELAKKEFKTYTKTMLKLTIQDIASYNKKKSVWEIKHVQAEKSL